MGSPATALQVYRRVLELLRESGLPTAEKVEILERAADFVQEESSGKAIWEMKERRRGKE